MCDLCDEKTREREATHLRRQADALRSLASDLYALADGRQKPHTAFTKSIESKAHNAIRYLVDEWLS
jgi:hypothetical protein